MTTRTRATIAKAIDSHINVVGYVEASIRRSATSIFRSVGRHGVIKTVGKLLCHVVYATANRRLDNIQYRPIFDEDAINATLTQWGGPMMKCVKYSDPNIIN